jgi:hypothetical protein
VAHIVNTPEACRVWKHQPDRLAPRFFVEAVERFETLFFPPFLSQNITFSMALVRGQLPPIMALQQRVNRRPSQRIIKVMLDLADHNGTFLAYLRQKRLECSSLFFFVCSFVCAAPTRWNGAVAYGLSVKELVRCLLAQPMNSPIALAVCSRLNANRNENISACT